METENRNTILDINNILISKKLERPEFDFEIIKNILISFIDLYGENMRLTGWRDLKGIQFPSDMYIENEYNENIMGVVYRDKMFAVISDGDLVSPRFSEEIWMKIIDTCSKIYLQ